MSEPEGRARLVERAPAKLNLYLHVLARREDGYHRLDSLVVFADLADRLWAEPAADLSFVVSGPFAGRLKAERALSEDNLVLRAARALAKELGVAPKARLVLEKNLPVAAGIGGGSADAAAALRLLCRLWGRTPAADRLAALALLLGADVPVCLQSKPTYVGGIGECIEPAPPLPEAHLALINPGSPLATAEVFKARRGPFSEPARFAEAPRDAAHLAALLAERRNDLEAPARRLVPEAGHVIDALAAQPSVLLARMSGSGATVFGLCATAAQAQAAARILEARHPSWWCAATAMRAR